MHAEVRFDLLHEPLLRVRTAREAPVEYYTLPGALAALCSRTVTDFPGLSVHQRHPWYAFLVQLGAMALHRAGEEKPPTDEAAWRALLLGLTEGCAEAFALVVEDLSQPAFFQPPVPEGHLKGFKRIAETPDLLDLLPTAKNHDVKLMRVRHALPEHWVYALVSLQTMDGYSGKGNNGIARMNGGYANRPCVTFVPDLTWSGRFRRDLRILARVRQAPPAALDAETADADVVARVLREYPREGGAALLWLLPWDGATQLSLEQCDPYFIEICRRVRITSDAEVVVAHLATSSATRIAGNEQNGVTGDPWTPVSTGEKAKALTVMADGFSYRQTQKLLSPSDWEPAMTQRIVEDDRGDLVLSATALVRGQGQTDGFHTRLIPISGAARTLFMSRSGRARIAESAKKLVAEVDAIVNKVLKPALCTLTQAAPDRIDFRDARPARFIERFEKAVDERFFEVLWRTVASDSGSAEREWRSELRVLASAEFRRACGEVPLSSARAYRTIAAAERVFGGALRKLWPDLFQPESAVPDHDTAREEHHDGPSI